MPSPPDDQQHRYLLRETMSAFARALPTFVAAIVLVTIHMFANGVHSMGIVPKRDWLSAGGGAAVAYVFVHLLPELGRAHQAVGEPPLFGGFLERHVYLVALGGFLIFYGLQHLARRGAPRESDTIDERVFWIHIGSYASYNALIGYLLVHQEEPGTIPLLFFTVAVGLHFLVNDHGLREHFKARYDEGGRWLLSVAILAGWAIGLFVEIDAAVRHVLFALLAGSLILNVIKEELPSQSVSRYPAFLVGAMGYTTLLLLL